MMKSTKISIVLNVHNEGVFVRRTIASLRDAIYFSRQKGIDFELIVVLDRVDEFTRAVVRDIDFSFVPYVIESVDNGSLGLSRNAGVSLATGDYVALADADDLISFNYFSSCFDVVRDIPDAAVFPEYLYAFGARHHVTQYRDSDTFSYRAYFDTHPFISRIFVRRSILLENKFVETPRQSVYAYEDWHLNATLAAKGVSMCVARGAWLFYRQRPNSIMATTSGGRVIPYTPYFHPLNYRQRAKCIARRNYGRRLDPHSLLESMSVVELLHAANQIDPAIDVEHLRVAGQWSPPVEKTPNGDAYLEICEILERFDYDHVALVPFVSLGGGEKFLFNALSQIQKNEGGMSRILILCGESYGRHSLGQLERFRCDFIDVYEIAQRHGADLDQLVLRLLQSVASRAQLHLLPCLFSMRFISRYGRSTDDQVVNLYVFCSERFNHLGRFFGWGEVYSFISDFCEKIDRIISDNFTEIDRIKRVIDLPNTSLHVLYSCIECPSQIFPPRLRSERPAVRLLWASRLDAQKRPELLRLIAQRLVDEKMPVHIDVYGSSVFGGFDPGFFGGLVNVSYKGPFAGFLEIPLERYDLLLYTASFDGIPNVILEAMASGLPVMAPDVGGISELVKNDSTGVLIPNHPSDEAMVSAYVKEIRRVVDGDLNVDDLAEGARYFISGRHSEISYSAAVREIYCSSL